MKQLKVAKTGYLAISIIFYLAGLAYIILPQDAPLAVCISGGIILLAYGTIKIVGYFSKDLYCLAFQYDLACGLLLIIKPFQNRFVAHVVAGGALIAAGRKNQCVVTFAVKAAKNQLPETMEG